MEFTLHYGDSLEMMKNMSDNSVDLVVTSPPYADQRKSTYGGVKPDEYIEWFLPYASEIQRVLKDDGSFVLNIKEKVVDGQRHTYVIKLVLALVEEQNWLWTEEYLWHKTNAAPGKWPNRFRDGWEHLYHFTKNKKFVMNQDDVKVPIGDWAKSPSELKRKEGRQESKTQSGVGIDRKGLAQKDTVYPSNVLRGATESSNKGHSAVYPTWIPEFFIKLFSNPGDTILDPFMGSGTTAIAALKNGRNAVGAEILQDQANRCIERVSAETIGQDIKTIPTNTIQNEKESK